MKGDFGLIVDVNIVVTDVEGREMAARLKSRRSGTPPLRGLRHSIKISGNSAGLEVVNGDAIPFNGWNVECSRSSWPPSVAEEPGAKRGHLYGWAIGAHS
jgi:hypothetical protein